MRHLAGRVYRQQGDSSADEGQRDEPLLPGLTARERVGGGGGEGSEARGEP